MPQLQERALVLDVASYRESSVIVHLIAEHQGRVSLVARGVRGTKSKSAGHLNAALQPFNLLNARFSLKEGSTLGNLISAEVEQAAVAPHDSIVAYALISFWFEILRETSSEAATSDVFALTSALLTAQKTTPGLSPEYIVLLLKLCRSLGFAITWDQCVECGRTRQDNHVPQYFSTRSGGIVCSACAAAPNQQGVFKLHPNEARAALAIIRPTGTKTADAASPEKNMMALLTLIHRFLLYHIEHPLRTYGFVRNVVEGD